MGPKEDQKLLGFQANMTINSERLISRGKVGRRPQREIISPLEASLDHLWAILFHRLLKTGKGYIERFLVNER